MNHKKINVLVVLVKKHNNSINHPALPKQITIQQIEYVKLYAFKKTTDINKSLSKRRKAMKDKRKGKIAEKNNQTIDTCPNVDRRIKDATVIGT